MRLVVAAILIPAFAFADKFTTDVKVMLDEENAAITEAIQRVKVNACWKTDAKAKVRVEFDRGKPKTVELVENGDAKAAACITRAFKAVRLKDAPTLTVVVELEGVRHLDDQKRKRMADALAKLDTTKLDKFGQGTGVGTTRGSGTGGGGTADGDFVVAREPSTGSASAPKEVKVAFGDQQITGDLTIDDVQRVVKARAGIFRACYQKELNRTPGIGGKLVVKFTVAADGSVKRAKAVSSTVGSAMVDDCVVRQIMRLEFPPRDGETVVSYPFMFSAG